jgi:DNA polymerase I-like protein with 3'-5' exonuclease and polymerase domains
VSPEARPDLSVAAGIVTISEHRNTKLATSRMLAYHRAHGTQPALTKTGIKKVKKGESLADGECVALDREACLATGDDLLEAYADMVHLSKIVSSDIPTLRGGVDLPIHTHYEVILDTGRTSSSKPNVQNQARGKKDRIGARECFVPRPGRVLIDSDFGSLELHTLAQACLWLLGRSRLAEALNAGIDVHTLVASMIQGIPYEQGVALKKAKDYEFDNSRNAAKPLNFGKPGGIGAEKMTDYASRGYGVKRPLEFWQYAIRVWEQTWTEMPDFFAMVKGLKLPGTNLYNVVQPWSGRLRAGATFNAACNSFFQGLGADVAKVAGWKIFKACYVDRSSPLFGSRPVLFVHDQFLIETLEAQAAAAAAETERLMNEAGREVLPDVPVKCEPILARRYSKTAEKKIDPLTGSLTAWEDLRLEKAA